MWVTPSKTHFWSQSSLKQPYRYKYDNVAKCDTRAPPNTQYASGITTHVGTRTYSKGNDRTHW